MSGVKTYRGVGTIVVTNLETGEVIDLGSGTLTVKAKTYRVLDIGEFLLFGEVLDSDKRELALNACALYNEKVGWTRFIVKELGVPMK